MHRSLLDILVVPISKAPLQVEEHQYGAGGSIVQGVLRDPEGRSYVITNGIPRFVLTFATGHFGGETRFFAV